MSRPKPRKFIESISYDIRLAPYDIQASLAHAAMLGRRRIIPGAAAKKIARGLKSILNDLNRGWRIPVQEDIHFAVESELIRRIGEVGGMLHTGRSRNDQVVTDLFLYLRDHIRMVVGEIARVEKAAITLAVRYKTLVMPGFTHLQHAQPVLFSHHILAYAWMLERDRGRLNDLQKRLDYLPLGSAALAGTSFPLDRWFVARALGFGHLSENSIDATSSRDTVAEFLSACAILMSNLSRWAEEIVIWSSPEFSFIELTEEFTSGSSIMPQKRNPDVAEIIRGETGRVYGSLVAILTILKGLPLSYNRDLQEDKPPLFDTVDTVMGCLSVMAPMVASLRVNEASIKNWCNVGFLAATELADFLAERGVPFRTGHGIVRKIVAYCQSKGIPLGQLSLSDLKGFHPKFDARALDLLSPEKVVRAKTSYGGTSPASVERQISTLRRSLKAWVFGLMLLSAPAARAEVVYPTGVSEQRMATEILWKDVGQLKAGQRPRVILVLGGGGARGLSHIGVLRVLEQERIPVDQIVGVSVGALIGALYASGLSVDEIERMARDIGWNKVSDFSRVRMVKLVLNEQLFSTRKMEVYLNRRIGNKTFADLRIPFACLATDIETGEPVVFNEGPVVTAARASATIPVIFRPVEVRQRRLVDGGLVDNLPVDIVPPVEGDVVVGVLPRGEMMATEVTSIFKAMVRTIDIQKEQLMNEQRNKADFMIEPDVGSVTMVDLARSRECIEAGTLAALKGAVDLKRLIIQRVVERRRKSVGER